MLQIPFLRKVKPKEILVITHCTLFLFLPQRNSSFLFCIQWREIMNNIRKPLHTSRAADFGNEITSRYDCRPDFKTPLFACEPLCSAAEEEGMNGKGKKKTTSRAQQYFIFFNPNDRISKNLCHYIWLKS
ncbi:hypothetical protein CEXT_51291 [Caerostris extrusa]|uniref:Uncharacterized protein n=1 Tax=Caerostris extrusa TaxID=172846 RepID=A0AAV4W212_CAEEX|nr:hypothetical protein CEXT_51291 [Caerostris extrusa]